MSETLSRLWSRFTDMLSASFAARVLAAVAGFLDSQWQKSHVARFFTGSPEERRYDSIFLRLGGFVSGLWARLLRFLRLDGLLRESLIAKPMLWMTLTALLAPIIPTMAVLAFVLAGYVSLALYLGAREMRLVYSPVNKWLYAYALVFTVSTLTGAGGSASFQSAALTLAFTLFFTVMINSIRGERDIGLIFAALTLSGAAVAAYGVWQAIMGVTPLGNWLDQSFTDISRVYSTLENPNVLAEYLLLMIPIAAVTAFTAKGLRGRVAASLATLLMLAAMVLTYSRGGWLGLIIAAALFLILLDRRFVLVGVIAIIAVFAVMPDSILNRFASISDLSDSSTAYRINIWLGSLSMLRDFWFCGIGTGPAAYAAVYPFYDIGAIASPHSHSLYLEVAAECGAAGIVTFVALIVSLIRAMTTRLSKASDRRERLRLIALLSGLGGFLFQSATDYSFYNYRVMLVFWIVAALAAAMCLKREESEQ